MDRGVWWATVHMVTESDTTEQLNTFTSSFTRYVTLGILLFFLGSLFLVKS